MQPNNDSSQAAESAEGCLVKYYVSPTILGSVAEAMPADSAYTLGWKGDAALLKIKNQEDKVILEKIYDAFNREKRPAGAEHVRSLSPGDVVCIEEKSYLCLPVGWRRLESFQPGEKSEEAPIKSDPDVFDSVIGGRKLPEQVIRRDIAPAADFIVRSEMDRLIARLLLLHPQLQDEYPDKDIASLSEDRKRAIIKEIYNALGIIPLKGDLLGEGTAAAS